VQAETVGYGALQKKKKKTERMEADPSPIPGTGPASQEVPRATA